MDLVKYAKEQEELRRLQYTYGSKKYSFPDTYKERVKAYTDAFEIGDKLSIGHDVYLYRTHKLEGNIKIGRCVILANNVTIDYSGKVIIEDYVTISEGAKIYSHKNDLHKLSHREDNSAIPILTTIHKGAWIGSNAIILPGVTIGEYAVVGAGSVVTYDVTPYTVWAGNPAKCIKDVITE